MMEKSRQLAYCAAMTAALFAAPVAALEVYQWTDENGVVHFSQWAPNERVDGLATLSVEDTGDNGLGISEEDDPDGYQAHREEMDALWTGIEERREQSRSRQDSGPGTEIIYVGAQPNVAVPYFVPGFRPFPRPLPRLGPKPGRGPGEREEAGPPPSVPFKRP